MGGLQKDCGFLSRGVPDTGLDSGSLSRKCVTGLHKILQASLGGEQTPIITVHKSLFAIKPTSAKWKLLPAHLVF